MIPQSTPLHVLLPKEENPFIIDTKYSFERDGYSAYVAEFIGCGQEGSCSSKKWSESKSETSQSDQSIQEEEVVFPTYDKKNPYSNRPATPDINQLFAVQPKQQDYNPKLTYV